MSRYGKRTDVIVHEQDPFNVETARGAGRGPLTATDAFYVRGHGAVPELDPSVWRLRVQGLVERRSSLSLSTLREAFREREVTATLQCAGNRRAGLMAIRDIAGEAPWGPGATGTATWKGVALRRCSRWPARRATPRTWASKAPTCARRPSRRSPSAARCRSRRRAGPRSCSPGR